MPRKKSPNTPSLPPPVAEITKQPIAETIERNFMPYAMSVIVARAIPEIDGFKPSHRKLLYTMFKMGLLTGPRTKSANVVGQTMRLNPHGDAAIYKTMVRLTRGNETLIHPFVDSKGSFGKHYSEDEYAASRYTEVKLDSFCSEIFAGIERNAVDMTENYDNTMLEPTLLPTAFPNILVSPNSGIAVAMASSICSFNLAEVCDGAIQMLHNPDTSVDQMLDIIKAPDFQGGASLLYNKEQLREIYRTGRGTFRLRSRWKYDKDEGCIEVIQIPYSTTIDLIMKKLSVLIKEGKLKEITDYRDEIDISGFRLTLDLRRGTDPDKLMAKLLKLTPLEESFNCMFTVLIDGSPKTLGVCELLNEWIRFRLDCVKREFKFDLDRKNDKLHLLLGLGKILLDIDKAIKIVRDTEHESDVVPNLMEGFGIDEPQAEYIAEIKLRQLNREYILNRLSETDELQKAIADLEDMLNNEKRQKAYIVAQLREIKRKYSKPRQTQLIYEDEAARYDYDEESVVDDFSGRVYFTREGYFKKITLLSLRGNDEHKLKQGDDVIFEADASNSDELLFFSDHAQVYKAKAADFEAVKASDLGDYIPAKLGFDENERAIFCALVKEYSDTRSFVFIFENGKGVRVPVSAYQTKTNRRRLTGAYSDASPIVAIFDETQPFELLLHSSNSRAIVFDSSLITQKTTRGSQGAQLITLRQGVTVTEATTDVDRWGDPKKLRKKKLPAAGVPTNEAGQQKLI